jgi:hypothetical protein
VAWHWRGNYHIILGRGVMLQQTGVKPAATSVCSKLCCSKLSLLQPYTRGVKPAANFAAAN